MKILTAEQVRQADRYTIAHEPVASIDLMERAAGACATWLQKSISRDRRIVVLCGPGNNGGDGLAIARLLHRAGYTVEAWAVQGGKVASPDFRTNEQRLRKIKGIPYRVLNAAGDMDPGAGDVVIDALFGTGLARPLDGIFADIVRRVNDSPATIVSIDMPSGMAADRPPFAANQPVIEAAVTLTFQVAKPAMVFAAYARWIGRLVVLPIGLDDGFIDSLPSNRWLVDAGRIRDILHPRPLEAHKGRFGHAAVVAGSYGKMGAAVLAVRACLRSGAGLTTAVVPACGYEIMQVTAPEAMCLTPSLSDESNPMTVSGDFNPDPFSALAIGPGIGTNRDAARTLKTLLEKYRRPVVLDADALNILAENPSLLERVPPNSILTPHPREFERLAGPTADPFERNRMQVAFSRKHGVVVVLKGQYTCTSTADGMCHFNPTGNAGMAKGGTGDALTGVITALLAQGYAAADAAVAGVYVHGLAGDRAKRRKGSYGLLATDLIRQLGPAFESLLG